MRARIAPWRCGRRGNRRPTQLRAAVQRIGSSRGARLRKCWSSSPAHRSSTQRRPATSHRASPNRPRVWHSGRAGARSTYRSGSAIRTRGFHQPVPRRSAFRRGARCRPKASAKHSLSAGLQLLHQRTNSPISTKFGAWTSEYRDSISSCGVSRWQQHTLHQTHVVAMWLDGFFVHRYRV